MLICALFLLLAGISSDMLMAQEISKPVTHLTILIGNNNAQRNETSQTMPSSTTQLPVHSFSIPLPRTRVAEQSPSSLMPPAESSNIIMNNTNEQNNQFINLPLLANSEKKSYPPGAYANKNIFTSLLSSCWEYKGTVLLCALASLYGITLASVWYQNYILTKQSRWSMWQAEIPLQLFKTTPAHQLAEQLYDAITLRYAQEKQPYGFLTCTMRFLQDVDLEIMQLNHYIIIHSWLNKSYLSYFFPVKRLSIPQAQQMQQRLNYFKETLLSWMNTGTSENQCIAQSCA